jgi:signal peptide peptidase SppA
MHDLAHQSGLPGGPGEVVRARFAGRPALITESALDAFITRAEGPPQAEQTPPTPFASRFAGEVDWTSRYSVTTDGVCIIRVHGVLIDRGAWLGMYWGMTSYEGLAEQVRRAAADPDIRHILLDIDSGGGMVAGLFDFVQVLREARHAKPVTALANSMACSAAYAIGCAADALYVNRQGMAGSIGVVVLHTSYAEALRKGGVKATYIKSGALKTLGNRYEDLSDEHAALLQAGVDETARTFFAHVTAERGLSGDYLQSLEARVFTGEAAVTAGLADGVASFEELLAYLRHTPARLTGQSRGHHHMQFGTAPGGHAATGNIEALITQAVANIRADADKRATPAATAQPASDGRVSRTEAEAMASQAATAAVTAAMARVKTILTSEHAKGREVSAQALALDPALSADTALTLLQGLPKAEAAAPAAAAATTAANPLQAEMARRGNAAGVKPEGSGDGATGSAHRPSFGSVLASHIKPSSPKKGK